MHTVLVFSESTNATTRHIGRERMVLHSSFTFTEEHNWLRRAEGDLLASKEAALTLLLPFSYSL